MLPGWRRPRNNSSASTSAVVEYKGVVNAAVVVAENEHDANEQDSADTLHSLMTTIQTGKTGRLHWLAIIPPQFQVFKPTKLQPLMPQLTLHNSDLCQVA